MDRLWEITAEECLLLNWIYGVEFQAVVLMPNHYHLILTVPEHDLGIVMNDFMRSISKKLNWISGRKGHSFGGPYYRCLINNTLYFSHALKYVYRNPVRANLCLRVEDFPFSSLHGLLGKSYLPFPIYWTRVGMELAVDNAENAYELLDWLNLPVPVEEESQVRKALRRPVFGPKGTAYLFQTQATAATNPMSPRNER